MRLKDRVCIVSGAASGIGQATAVELAREGGRVVACDINPKGLEETAGIISSAGGVLTAALCDVTSRTDIDKMVKKTVEEFGAIHVLVNCAGGSSDSFHLLEVTEEQYDKTINLNLKSVFLMMQAVIPHMLANKCGVIVNVASQAGRRGHEQTRPHYTAAKSAVLGLTRHAAREFGPSGIRCVAVAPGRCLTGQRTREIWKERERLGTAGKILENIALRRMSTPEEQAAVISFLCSDAASFIAGATIDVNGGETCI